MGGSRVRCSTWNNPAREGFAGWVPGAVNPLNPPEPLSRQTLAILLRLPCISCLDSTREFALDCAHSCTE